MPEQENEQWLTIVEAQQQELHELRSQLEQQQDLSPPSGARSAFVLSPASSVSSRTSSRSSTSRKANDISLDLKRYAKMCTEVEVLQNQLTERDVIIRELQAQTTQLARTVELHTQDLRDARAHAQVLVKELISERSLKEEAVERAAHAILRNEELSRSLVDVKRDLETTRMELSTRSDMVTQLQSRCDEYRVDADMWRERVSKLEDALRVAHREQESLEERLRRQQDSHLATTGESTIKTHHTDRVVELEQILELQTAQLERLQAALVDLDRVNTNMRREHAADAEARHQQLAQQLHANIALQQAVDESVTDLRRLKQTLRESEERVMMQEEEVAAYAAWRRSAVRREAQRDASYLHLQASYEKLERTQRQLESSRKKAVCELLEAKRQLQHAQTTMQGVDSELQRMNKTFSIFRARETNVTSALREYARRNRVLQGAVKLMSTKVRHLSQSLRQSEKRKHQVAIEAHGLKRNLVVERCQREDLLKQCIDLESSLLAFQRAAMDSADRARTVEKENAVLQHAVAQLCAYSRELTQSQEAMQQELKSLEVHGRMEPQVFG